MQSDPHARWRSSVGSTWRCPTRTSSSTTRHPSSSWSPSRWPPQTTDRRVNQATPRPVPRLPYTGALRQGVPGASSRSTSRRWGCFETRRRTSSSWARRSSRSTAARCRSRGRRSPLLPGVGPKTAGVVSMHLGGDAAFPVDTHVLRLSGRLGFSRKTDPDEVEQELQRLVPKERWFWAISSWCGTAGGCVTLARPSATAARWPSCAPSAE